MFENTFNWGGRHSLSALSPTEFAHCKWATMAFLFFDKRQPQPHSYKVEFIHVGRYNRCTKHKRKSGHNDRKVEELIIDLNRELVSRWVFISWSRINMKRRCYIVRWWLSMTFGTHVTKFLTVINMLDEFRFNVSIIIQGMHGNTFSDGEHQHERDSCRHHMEITAECHEFSSNRFWSIVWSLQFSQHWRLS